MARAEQCVERYLELAKMPISSIVEADQHWVAEVVKTSQLGKDLFQSKFNALMIRWR